MTTTKNQYDAIVIGAKVAGAATALMLARSGMRVLLADTERPQPELPTRPLMRGAMIQVSRWGLRDQIAGASPPITRTTYFQSFVHSRERRVLTVKPAHGVDAFHAPRTQTLAHIIATEAAQAGAELRPDVRLRSVLFHGDRAGGVLLGDDSGAVFEARSELTIGADGHRSDLAKAVAATYARVGRHPVAVTHAYWSGLDVDGAQFICVPGGRAGIIPTGDGEYCVFASGSPQRIRSGGTRVIVDAVTAGSVELGDELRRAAAPGPARTTPALHSFLRRPVGPGWALVGDAAGFKDPTSTHGLGDELRDAELLAHALNSSTVSVDAALAQYARERATLARPIFELVDRIAGHGLDDVTLTRTMIELSSRISDEVEHVAGLAEAVPA